MFYQLFLFISLVGLLSCITPIISNIPEHIMQIINHLYVNLYFTTWLHREADKQTKKKEHKLKSRNRDS